jgi:hypothetical protein
MSEAKRIVFEFDRVWIEIMKSPRGRQRSRNFIQLMKLAQQVHDLAKVQIDNDKLSDKDRKFHREFQDILKKWSVKRRMPIQ